MNNNTTSLYKRHKIIYTDPVPGYFSNLRILSMSFMALLFFLMPWFNYNGRPALIFDIFSLRFYFFNYVFWPQDFFLFAIFGIMAILLLFTVTVYSGRIWCGFFCPQSIWIRLVNFITFHIEGSRYKRVKLDNTSNGLNFFYKKFLKHVIIFLLSFLTGITFLGYFIPIVFLFKVVFFITTNMVIFFWIVFFTVLIYFNISWFKEQFCFLVCPYARLQSVMFDQNTLIVTYNETRGEKRGHRSKDEDYTARGLGDCIDCKKCVTCCPTGIDIRDGLQIECISCAACIDACDSVMEKMGYAKGLIKYKREVKNITFLNIRLLVYSITLIILFTLSLFILYNRDLTQFNITRGQSQLYNILNDTHLENLYVLKIINKKSTLANYKISVVNDNVEYLGLKYITLGPEEIVSFDVKLVALKNDINSMFTDIYFKIENVNNVKDFLIKKTKFISPT